MMRLAIIILSYNTKELTIACINSITRQYKEQLEKGEFELIIVDNASTDSSYTAISNFQFRISNFQLKLVKNKENYGFSKGNNIGARKAKGEYILFLNSDTQVNDNGLDGMVEFLKKHEEVGILGAKLTSPEGTSQPSAGKFYNILNVFLMLFGFERLGSVRFCPEKESPVDWVNGAALMIRKNLFDKLGGFDERFFMYIEDMELCFRARNVGFLTYFYPNVSISHRELGSSNRTFAIVNIYQGLLYFYKKHTNYIQYTFVRVLLLAKACIAIAVGIFTHDTYLTSTYKKTLSIL